MTFILLLQKLHFTITKIIDYTSIKSVSSVDKEIPEKSIDIHAINFSFRLGNQNESMESNTVVKPVAIKNQTCCAKYYYFFIFG